MPRVSPAILADLRFIQEDTKVPTEYKLGNECAIYSREIDSLKMIRILNHVWLTLSEIRIFRLLR